MHEILEFNIENNAQDELEVVFLNGVKFVTYLKSASICILTEDKL